MHPIIAALKHHKTTVVLVALEIALTCAIASNAVFIIGNRLGVMHVVSGVADKQLIWVSSSGLDTDATKGSQSSCAAADMAALRTMSGVTHVVMTNSLPLTRRSWTSGVSRAPGKDKSTLSNVVFYAGTQGVIPALGITLAEGRDFLPQEYTDYGFSDPKKDVPRLRSSLAVPWPRRCGPARIRWASQSSLATRANTSRTSWVLRIIFLTRASTSTTVPSAT